MTVADRLLGGLLGGAALAAMAWGSNGSIAVHPSADAMLRLAWSAVPERVETCREATADELARQPPHMRQPVVCEGAAASYRLTVRTAGAVVVDRVVRAGGLRHDRRLYVFEELRVPAGETAIDVRFDRIEATAAAAGRPGPPGPQRRVQADAVAPHLAFADRLAFVPRGVVLVTYDARQRALIVVRDAKSGSLRQDDR